MEHYCSAFAAYTVRFTEKLAIRTTLDTTPHLLQRISKTRCLRHGGGSAGKLKLARRIGYNGSADICLCRSPELLRLVYNSSSSSSSGEHEYSADDIARVFFLSGTRSTSGTGSTTPGEKTNLENSPSGDRPSGEPTPYGTPCISRQELYPLSQGGRVTQKSVRQLYCPESFVDTTNTDGNVVEGQWRNEVDIDSYTTNRSTSNTSRNARTKEEAHAMRESLKEYFNSPEGELPWQREIVNRGAYGDII
ncbi:unnamed protein product [Trichogramma brassicae]|uniref:Uncharacterized protein n=1 Tax=Trichogramma brassicae TaxID=86971 RepID=A0A6H5HWX5_9HYME|nr:unnamed protein product [Trichogramma brassicae]